VGDQREDQDQVEDQDQQADDEGLAFDEEPPPEKVQEIEQERGRRLDPENRPENAVVDNTDTTLPTVEEFAEMNKAEESEGSAGTADPSEKFRENPPSEDEVKEIEEERARRTDPANRPDNTEVDNTGDNMPDIAKG
jgi:hypothetical protein